VALAADVGTLLLAGRVDVGIVGVGAAALAPALDAGEVRRVAGGRGELLDAGDESRPRNAQLHRLGIVAVYAGDRVGLAAAELLEQLVGVPIAELADRPAF
jgi:hypothetical protein